jgi:hypothetical protein
MRPVIYTPITPDEVREARRLAAELGPLRNSIRRGKGNVYGYVGELLVARHFGVPWLAENNTYHYDLRAFGYTWDVKTKRTTVEPRGEYFVSVADHNTRQRCDFYFFCRVHENMRDAWLLGAMARRDYYRRAIYFAAGEREANGFVFRADCYNLPVRSLVPIHALPPLRSELSHSVDFPLESEAAGV